MKLLKITFFSVLFLGLQGCGNGKPAEITDELAVCIYAGKVYSHGAVLYFGKDAPGYTQTKYCVQGVWKDTSY